MEAARKELIECLKNCYNDGDASLKKKDKKDMKKYYAEDAVLVWPGHKLAQGKKAVDERVETLVNSPAPTNFSHVREELVMMSEEKAFETVTFTVYNDDGTIFSTGKNLVIWKKVGDKWLMEVDSFNYDNFPDCNQVKQ